MPEWTRDEGLTPLDDDPHSNRGTDAEYEDMGHTHAGAKSTGHQIHVVGSEGCHTVHIGCFSWREDENVGERWDTFAAEMWKWGLRPHEDEPVFSVTEGGITFDHYYLVPIYDEGEE